MLLCEAQFFQLAASKIGGEVFKFVKLVKIEVQSSVLLRIHLASCKYKNKYHVVKLMKVPWFQFIS
jgi:hypothetical protein